MRQPTKLDLGCSCAPQWLMAKNQHLFLPYFWFVRNTGAFGDYHSNFITMTGVLLRRSWWAQVLQPIEIDHCTSWTSCRATRLLSQNTNPREGTAWLYMQPRTEFLGEYFNAFFMASVTLSLHKHPWIWESKNQNDNRSNLPFPALVEITTIKRTLPSSKLLWPFSVACCFHSDNRKNTRT